MAGVFVDVGELRHWESVLPILDWLGGAGLHVYARRRTGSPSKRELAALARHCDVPVPQLSWRRRPPRREPTLALGTCEDLHLLRRSGRPFVALPRVPLPALLLSEAVAERFPSHPGEVRPAVDAFLEVDGDERVPELAALTEGLPFQSTGLPELDRPALRSPGDSLVLLLDASMAPPLRRGRRARNASLRNLAAALAPLQRLGIPVELRPVYPADLGKDVPTLTHLSRWVSRVNPPRPRLIGLGPEPDWPSLRDARAVLVGTSGDLLRGLASGVERIWRIPLPEVGQRTSDALAPAMLRDELAYEHWAASRGWEKPPEATTRLAATFAALIDGNASQRVAQAVIAAVLAGLDL